MKKTNLKKLLYVPFLYALLISNSFSIEPYIEGQVGVGVVEDTSGSSFTSSGGFSAAVSLDNLSYENGLLLGAEFGVKNIVNNLRMGIGIISFEAEFENGEGVAALSSGGTVILAAAGSFTAADLASAGITADNDVTAYSLNTYLDLNTNSDLTPFIGIGFGFADIENAEDNEFAISLLFGGNYKITDKAYIGAKGGYYNIAGPTDKIGINYDDINAWTFNVALGIEF